MHSVGNGRPILTDRKLLEEIVDYVKRYDLFSSVVVTSFHPVVPFMINKKESRLLTGLSYSRHGITSYFEKAHPRNLPYKYFGQFLDETQHFGRLVF
ncbi:hypothetical protein OSTOST_09138 [Ostertagia ostertagi]